MAYAAGGLPCAVLCLLSLSLDFRPSPDIQKCAYCARMRALSLNCEYKPLACAEWDPDSLIYCLSRDERPWGRDSLKRSTRCISHANLLNQSLPISRETLDALATISSGQDQTEKQCTFEAARECQCPDCEFHGETMEKPQVQMEEPKDELPVDLGTELHDIALLLDKLIVEQEQQQPIIETMATRKNTRRTLPPKLAAASAPLRPLPPLKVPSSSSSKEQGIMPMFPADFLYSSASIGSTNNFPPVLHLTLFSFILIMPFL